MKYRHNQGVRLALTSGHVVFVGQEWQELHERFHGAALENRCEVDQGIIHAVEPAKVEASAQAVVNTDDVTVIRAALKTMLERVDDDDFTVTGLPSIKAVRTLSGIEVEKDVVYKIFRELEKEAAD